MNTFICVFECRIVNLATLIGNLQMLLEIGSFKKKKGNKKNQIKKEKKKKKKKKKEKTEKKRKKKLH